MRTVWRGVGRNYSTSANENSIKEIKCTLDGNVQEFTLEKWRVVDQHSAVARWVARQGNTYGQRVNSTSWGVWSIQFPNLTAYRLHDPDGNLIKYRFDVIDELEIHHDRVFFKDLLLDAVVDGNSKELIFEDEDEVQEALKNNSLTEQQILIINSTKELLSKDTVSILRHVDNLVDAALRLY